MDTPGGDLARFYQQAVEELGKAVELNPAECKEEIDVAERAIVRLRDRLIMRLRESPATPDTAYWRAMLKEVNAALSLVVGVEYPAMGAQREMLLAAYAALNGMGIS